jgi:hypothetical protein
MQCWSRRYLFQRINLTKDFDLASRYLERLRLKRPEETKYTVNLFHLYLQMGHSQKASQLIPSLPDDVKMESEALLALLQNEFSTAIAKYSQLLESHKSLIYTNNLALAHLYTANAQSALAALEPYFRQKTSNAGVLPYSVYNLCTVYEIRDDRARSRKETVMEQTVSYYGDICSKGHFKLDSLR